MTIMAVPEPDLLTIEPGFRENRPGEAKRGRLRRGAIIAAAVAHAAVIAALLLDWPFSFGSTATEPPPIAVTLVAEVPPPPAPPPPEVKPQPNPPPLHELRSGRDQETTAPPQAEAKGAEAAPKPEAEPDKPDAREAPKPKPSPPAPPASPKTKEAARETAPQPVKRGSVDRAPGETEKEGDPYLNRLWAMIEQHRTYPSGAVGSLGLNLEGTVVYLIALSPGGAIEAMRLERSSGAIALDEAARRMIEKAAPFPPLPNYYPRNGVTVSVTIHLFPTAS